MDRLIFELSASIEFMADAFSNKWRILHLRYQVDRQFMCGLSQFLVAFILFPPAQELKRLLIV
jgi:hypothetical protein